MKQFGRYYEELPFHPTETHENLYYYENDFFSYGDGISLYSMLRHHQPKRVIEVG